MKGIKTILGALAAASLLFSVNANGKIVRGAYETNKAFDNTFIGIAGGVNSVVPSVRAPKNWGNIGLAVDVNFGKWWTPAIGMRLGYHGLWDNAKIAFQTTPSPVTKRPASGTSFLTPLWVSWMFALA